MIVFSNKRRRDCWDGWVAGRNKYKGDDGEGEAAVVMIWKEWWSMVRGGASNKREEEEEEEKSQE